MISCNEMRIDVPHPSKTNVRFKIFFYVSKIVVIVKKECGLHGRYFSALYSNRLFYSNHLNLKIMSTSCRL